MGKKAKTKSDVHRSILDVLMAMGLLRGSLCQVPAEIGMREVRGQPSCYRLKHFFTAMGDRSGYHLPIHPRRRLKMEMFLSSPLRAAVAFRAVVACVSSVHAQERRGGERREIQRERFHTDHWVFDHRFNHNH